MKQLTIRSNRVKSLMVFLVLVTVFNMPMTVFAKKCSAITANMTAASMDYLNKIYIQQYPSFGLEFMYGTDHDKEVLTKMSNLIVEGKSTIQEKAEAVCKWVSENVTYLRYCPYSVPSDVFYERQANCLGYAELAVELLRLQGIRAVVIAGWRGDMDTLELSSWEKLDEAAGHGWFCVYDNGSWGLYDPRFGIYNCKDLTYINKYYLFGMVDGITPIYEGMTTTDLYDGCYIAYVNGRFMQYWGGMPASQYFGNNTNASYGINMISYMCRPKGSYDYIENPEREADLIEDELHTNGFLSMMECARPNGTLRTATILKHGGKTWFYDNVGNAYYLENVADYDINYQALTIPIGDRVRLLSSAMDLETINSPLAQGEEKRWGIMEGDAATVDDYGWITAVKEGECRISFYGSPYILIQVAANVHRTPDFSLHSKKNDDTDPGEQNTVLTDTASNSDSNPNTTNTASKSLPVKGTVLKKGKYSYKVTKKGKEVAFVKISGNPKTVKIPSTVEIEGCKYKVTSIASNALKGKKKLTAVTIGSNVSSIGTKAFSGCVSLKKVTIPAKVVKLGTSAFQGDKKLKTITIKSTKLTKKTVGKNAFKDISAKATVKVPKKSLKTYKKWLREKGLSKNAKIK